MCDDPKITYREWDTTDNVAIANHLSAWFNAREVRGASMDVEHRPDRIVITVTLPKQ